MLTYLLAAAASAHCIMGCFQGLILSQAETGFLVGAGLNWAIA